MLPRRLLSLLALVLTAFSTSGCVTGALLQRVGEIGEAAPLEARVTAARIEEPESRRGPSSLVLTLAFGDGDGGPERERRIVLEPPFDASAAGPIRVMKRSSAPFGRGIPFSKRSGDEIFERERREAIIVTGRAKGDDPSQGSFVELHVAPAGGRRIEPALDPDWRAAVLGEPDARWVLGAEETLRSDGGRVAADTALVIGFPVLLPGAIAADAVYYGGASALFVTALAGALATLPVWIFFV